MGASAPQATQRAEVRLQAPEERLAPAGEVFFARLHSAAEGVARYEQWGRLQEVGLWSDDVITISVHTARSEASFAAHRCHDFAEVYLPWDLIKEELELKEVSPDGKLSFELTLHPGRPSLGEHAHPSKYFDAFRRDREEAKLDRSVPRVGVTLRRSTGPPGVASASAKEAPPGFSLPALPGPEGAAAAMPPAAETPLGASPGSALAAGRMAESWERAGVASPSLLYGVNEVAAEDMKVLLRLQMQNQELRAQCGAGAEAALDEAEEALYSHVAILSQAVTSNYALLGEVDAADAVLASAIASLPEDRLLLVAAALGPSAPEVAGEESGNEESARLLAAELRQLCDGADGCGLLSRLRGGAEHLARLEAELAAAQGKSGFVAQPAKALGSAERQRQLEQQATELRAIDAESWRLQSAIEQEESRLAALEAQAVQQLQLDIEVERDEVENLRQAVRRNTGAAAELPPPPGTSILQAEAGQLQQQIYQAHGRNSEEQVSFEQQAADLREEARQLASELQRSAAQRAASEAELQALRRRAAAPPPRGGGADSEQQREELTSAKEALVKEIGRSQRRMDFFDKKVDQLKDEADDIRRRAHQIWQSVSVSRGPIVEVSAACTPGLAKSVSFQDISPAPSMAGGRPLRRCPICSNCSNSGRELSGHLCSCEHGRQLAVGTLLARTGATA